MADRSKRVLKDESGGLFVDSRGAGANIAETAAFMQGDKQILIFSDAGGTGYLIQELYIK